MRAFVPHLLRSTRYIVRQPMAWLVLPAAACLSIALAYWIDVAQSVFYAPWLVSSQAKERIVQWILLAFNASLVSLPLLWPTLVVALLPCTQRAPAGTGDKWALSTLPIRPRVRALAEVSAALLLILAVRIPLWLCVARHAHRLASPSVGCGWDLLLSLPLLLAWTANRRTALSLTRLLGAYVVAVATLVSASLGSDALLLASQLLGPFGVPVLGLSSLKGAVVTLPVTALLTVAVVYSIGRRSARDATHPRPSGLALHRPPSQPTRRFWADAAWRSLPLVALAVVPGLTFALAVLAHASARAWARDDTIAALVATLGLMVGLMTMALVGGGVSLYPLGLPVLGGAQRLFSGRYCASWSWLPVRAQTIRRVVYAHALLVPPLVQQGCVASVQSLKILSATVREAFPSHTAGDSPSSAGVWLFVTALGLALACWAGWTLCMAVGDRVRGTLAALGIGLGLVSMGLTTWQIGNTELRPTSYPTSYMPSLLLLLGAGLFAALPLVHLRRPRRVA